MRKCSNCGKDREVGTYASASNLCDECYIKAKYYNPDFKYPMVKKEIKEALEPLVEGEDYSFVDIVMIMHNCEQEIYDAIKCDAKANNRSLVKVFKEYDQKDIIDDLISNGRIEMKFSYFFCDNLIETVANYEDRNKESNIIFVG